MAFAALVFFAMAFEHSVVNMYLFPSGIMLGGQITWMDYFLWTEIPTVVGNLVGNALRHTPEDGEVRVSAFVDGMMLHACVADTGAGIPREALEIIFDKFVQVKGTTAPGSAGLGLAISKAVIDGTMIFTVVLRDVTDRVRAAREQ